MPWCEIIPVYVITDHRDADVRLGFIEVEDADGHSVAITSRQQLEGEFGRGQGEWHELPDGLWSYGPLHVEVSHD